MDWNKASILSNIGTFILTAIMLVIIAEPLLKQSPPTAQTSQSMPNSPAMDKQPENQLMNSWRMPSILAAALLLSGLLHYKAARLQRSAVLGRDDEQRQYNEEKSKIDNEQSGPASSPARIDEGRVMVNVDGVYLTNICKEHMAIQAEKLIQPFIGKWMKVVGRVADIKEEDSGMKVIFERNESLLYILTFDDRSWRDHLLVMPRGTQINALGKIQNIAATWISLTSCKLQ
jgi:hypothetical protein